MKKYAKIQTNEASPLNVFDGTDTEWAISQGFVEQEVEQGYDCEWYLAGHAPQKPQAMIAAERIVELKALLAGTDYKAIKYSEGVVSEEEYAETKALRIAWRAEINQLEAELSS